jgi:hypothetical protein
MQAPQAVEDPIDMAMVITDSDRHYIKPSHKMGGCTPKIHTIVETVDEDEENPNIEVEEGAEELFPHNDGGTIIQEDPDVQTHPYGDPYISPPDEPPPKPSRKKNREPTARHADDKPTKQRPTKTGRPNPKHVRRDWQQGISPPGPPGYGKAEENSAAYHGDAYSGRRTPSLWV